MEHFKGKKLFKRLLTIKPFWDIACKMYNTSEKVKKYLNLIFDFYYFK